jgi:hypothetical protein
VSFNLTFAIFFGASAILISMVAGYFATKYKMTYDKRLTPALAKRAYWRITALLVIVWLIFVVSISIHDYA